MIQLLEDPWAVCEQDFPWEEAPSEKLKFLLNYAVLAPSGYNTQPWRFKVAGAEAALFADRSRTLPVSDPESRELVMSCGAALFNLRTAIRHYGCEPVVRTFPDLDDPDLLAYVRIGAPKETALLEHRLFMAIKKRRTHRLPFDARPVPAPVLRQLEAAACLEGATLHVIQDEARRGRLVEMIAEGDRLQRADPLFRRELASWMHPNQNGRRDGLPGYAQGISDLTSYAGPLLVRAFDVPPAQARVRELALDAPVLAVLSTVTDNPPTWLTAGQALCRVLLTASDHGLQASFLNQPIETAALRPQVMHLLGTDSCPQLILRIGYGPEAKPTPRRAVRDVLATF